MVEENFNAPDKTKKIIDKIFSKPKEENVETSKRIEVRSGIVKEIYVKSPLEDRLVQTQVQKVVFEKPQEKKSTQSDFKFDKLAAKTKKEAQKESTNTLLIIPSEEYTKNIYFLAKHLSEKYSKVLYVSLNELYSNIMANFKTRKINPQKFYFVDAITMTAQTNPNQADNCTFVVSPSALVELSLAISIAIENKKPGVLLFDSISTLLIYENEKTTVQFIHSLIGKIKAAGIDSFLTALEGDSQRQAVKDLGMFVDDFLTIDKFKMYRVELEIEPAKKSEEKKRQK